MKKLVLLWVAVLFCSAGYAAVTSSQSASADEMVPVSLTFQEDWRFAAGADKCSKQVFIEYHNGTGIVRETPNPLKSTHHYYVKKGTTLVIDLSYQANNRVLLFELSGTLANTSMEYPDPLYWEIRETVNGPVEQTIRVYIQE